MPSCGGVRRAEGMPIEEGDFILIDYTLKIKETGQVMDTTLEEVAKETGLCREGKTYEPRLVVIGAGWVLKGLEERLKQMEAGEEKTIELPPEEAYGPRDPRKVEVIPVKRLSERGIRPRVGQRVEINGRIGVVRAIGSGRAQVDFNHPLAGRTLVYEVAVRSKIEDPVEKIRALIHRRLPLVPEEKFQVEIGEKEAVIKMPDEAFYVEGIQVLKKGIASDILRFFPEIEVVRFIEELKRS